MWQRNSLLFLLLLLKLLVFPIDVKVMTFNVRYDSGRDGTNSWQNRKELLLGFLLEQDADIICLQEVLHHQYTYLTDHMDSYDVAGNGRNDGKKKGEYAPIYFKQSKYDFCESGIFWLSETPNEVGTIGWDAKQPRIATWIKLREKDGGNAFIVINTHFDDIGIVARQKSAEVIMEWISKTNVPAILTGDFNDNSQSAMYEKLSNNANGIEDVHVIAKICHGVNYTFHGFGKIPYEHRTKIDYVFVRGIKELKSEIIPEEKAENGVFLSDHNPIIVVLSL